ncbi:NADP-dependent oxidoreductase [Actinomadura spongiicola]|uniref:NADP-dependent oxidoreductase n=1 Tax=Actinomadura spongiicola TaxID=2303421 RepID=A0A372G954_9ACTN|nr:NADP-dependent oxidoreductase [Actinomadura spongiicola]RFS81934.1 NADP-dependent oxidoreductase [Actinomadura spongiicola]
MPGTSHEVRLVVRPEGLPEPDHFAVVEVPMPVPGDGEVLVRNRFFHVFPALRTLIGGSVPGAPFPGLRPGDTLYGKAIGEVVSAPSDAGVRPGDLVEHWFGWREYAAVPAGQCSPLDGTLPDPAAHLGQAAIAYTALTRDARLRPGDTVFVSGGAGGIGSLAGQFARALGAGRVIGSTGSPDKAKRLVAELGYDAAILRGTGGRIADQLAEAAPDGIDVLVDNVGGEQLRAAIAAARPGARFALVGALAGQLSPDLAGGTAPVEIDTFQVILKGIEIRGFGGSTGPAANREWAERFGGWLRSGKVTFPHVRVAGIGNAPPALHEMIGGRHLGTVIVEL